MRLGVVARTIDDVEQLLGRGDQAADRRPAMDPVLSSTRASSQSVRGGLRRGWPFTVTVPMLMMPRSWA